MNKKCPLRDYCTLASRLMAVLFATILLEGQVASAATTDSQFDENQICQPSAIACVLPAKQIVVSDALSGDLMRIDPTDGTLIQRQNVGYRLDSMVARPSHNQLIGVDKINGQLILVACETQFEKIDSLQFESMDSSASKLPVPSSLAPPREARTAGRGWGDGKSKSVAYLRTSPNLHHIAVAPDGNTVIATSPWTKSASIVAVDDVAFADNDQTVPLPFSPGKVLAINSHIFVIADAFGGNLALVDSQQQDQIHTFHFRGHNIGGLALSVDKQTLLISHQIINPLARTDFDDIHWGNLIQNVISRIPLTALASTVSNLNSIRKLTYLGDVWRGFADPGDLIDSPSGLLVVSRGQDLAMLINRKNLKSVVQLGRYPASLIQVDENRFATIGKFSADLQFIEVGEQIQSFANSKLGSVPNTDALSGASLFYDANLAHDGWMSCSSCHVDGHTAGLPVDTLGDGSFGNPKSIPSLLGVTQTEPYGWLGNKPTLQHQLLSTLRNTMRGQSEMEQNADAEIQDDERQTIAQLIEFMKTLVPPSPELTSSRSQAIVEGREIFKKFGCVRCHRGETLTSDAAYDVGLVDELGATKFNPPSLRAVGVRHRLFHDGRAKDVTEVLGTWKHQVPENATAEEISALQHYLKEL